MDAMDDMNAMGDIRMSRVEEMKSSLIQELGRGESQRPGRNLGRGMVSNGKKKKNIPPFGFDA